MGDYDQIYLNPTEISTIAHRGDVDLHSDFFNLYPIFSSPMKGISGWKLVVAMAENNCLGILHRFFPTEQERYDNLDKILDAKVPFGAAIGINNWEQEFEFAKYAIGNGCNLLTLDLANGYLPQIAEKGKILRKVFGEDLALMSGNVINNIGAKYLEDSGFDFARIGIGNGCFGAGTRVLMANGTYKDIEKLNIDDRIIDGLGNPTNVICVKKTGIRRVMRYRNPISMDWTYCTPDHLHRIYDFEKYTENTYSGGIKKLAERNDVKWDFIFQANKRKFFTYPNKIYFEIKENFEINLDDFAIRETFVTEKSKKILPSKELGYILGTFLGDGTAYLGSCDNSEIGYVSWSFGLKEMEIAKKVSECCEKVLGKTPKIEILKDRKVIQVMLYYQSFSRFLQNFGKRTEKHLPDDYFCNNLEYLSGLFDGLIDSDGCIEDYGRIILSNTSMKLLEQFGIFCYLLYGSFPSVSKLSGKDSKLEGLVLENCNQARSARLGTSHTKKHGDFFTLVEFLEKEILEMDIPVYDIEVESEDHSFIANGVIVHNSVCTTKHVTGISRNVLAALNDCCKVNVSLVVDGGIKEPGDVVKSFACGADFVILGSVLAMANEAENEDGLIFGMASKLNHELNNKEIKSVEGKELQLDVSKKKPLKEILDDYLWGIRSACTYLNCKSYKDIFFKTEIVPVNEKF